MLIQLKICIISAIVSVICLFIGKMIEPEYYHTKFHDLLVYTFFLSAVVAIFSLIVYVAVL